ncbi:MAG: hypothetical protein IJU57_06485 [Clostridia bacterium]|nr:hypothetical protein [Clostridia bacterium]
MVVFSFFALIVALVQVISLVIYYISIDAFSGNALYSVLFLTGAFLPALVLPIVALASRRGNMFVLGIPIFINLTFFVVQSILRRGMGISRGFMAYAEFSLYIILFILFFVFACIPIRHKTTVLPAIYLPFALILIVIETIMSIQYIVSMIEGSVYVGIWLEIVYYAKILLINVVYIIAMFASRRHKAIVK